MILKVGDTGYIDQMTHDDSDDRMKSMENEASGRVESAEKLSQWNIKEELNSMGQTSQLLVSGM